METAQDTPAGGGVMSVTDFEALVLSQRPAARPWAPVTDYSFEARRAIEGTHPELIRDVFQPTSVLDVGAGRGHLVRLLRAIGVKVVGADVNDAACDFYMDITEPALPQDWDLVICREVLEHLTILQIRRAVANLCQLTDRYVYVTTRFHPHPSSLLAVATSDDLDPTHISMLNQDFLRVLFVLEGFKRRADLERRMDWRHVGRCLVYERAT